jgi:hypothetical protein
MTTTAHLWAIGYDDVGRADVQTHEATTTYRISRRPPGHSHTHHENMAKRVNLAVSQLDRWPGCRGVGQRADGLFLEENSKVFIRWRWPD